MINGKIYYKWQFSIAMLNYRKVDPPRAKESWQLQSSLRLRCPTREGNEFGQIHRDFTTYPLDYICILYI